MAMTDIGALPHVERLYKKSECRTPLICSMENGDPERSIEALAKRECEGKEKSAVWKISMDTRKNERNALDYLEVGLANGDWLYLVNCEKSNQEVLREIGRELVKACPDPKNHPRRGDFRLWLLVEKEVDINDNIAPIFPAILTQNALFGWRDAANNSCKVVARSRVDPELVSKQDHTRQDRIMRGQDPQDESDDDDDTKKQTGLWFHRTVDFFEADAGNEVTRSVEDIFAAIDSGDVEKVNEICGKNTVDVNQIEKGGMTPLMWAIMCDNLELVRVLLSNGSDPRQLRSTNGMPPVFMSIETTEMLQLLIDFGADVEVRWQGTTLMEHPDTAPDIRSYLKTLLADPAN